MPRRIKALLEAKVVGANKVTDMMRLIFTGLDTNFKKKNY